MYITIRSTIGVDAAAAAATRRIAARGDFVRIRRGHFADSVEWGAATLCDRHLALIHASRAELGHGHGHGLVVSHRSAVALHGLPWIGPFGGRVFFADPSRDRGQSKGVIRRVGTAGRVPDSVLMAGIPTTSLAVTAVDVALSDHPWRAVAVLDAVLRRGVPHAALIAELSARGAPRARRRASELVAFADAAAESPGESITRWGAHVLGTPTPVLQQEFVTDWDGQERVDFWFPESGTVIEFDGAVKYRDQCLRNGRTPEDIVVEEKRREDALRRKSDVHHFGRVVWTDSMPGGQLPRRLHDAGVPLGPKWGEAWRAAADRTL